MEQAKGTGLEDQKGLFLQIIHTNIRQLTDYMRNELGMPSSYDEEILGREVAKVISYMAFNIDPLQVDVSADATITQFLQSTKNLTDISAYKNFRFYKLLNENISAVAACFGIYFITRVETIKGFSFKLPSWLRSSAKSTPKTELIAQGLDQLDDIIKFINENFGVGDNGKDMPDGGIYYFYKYYKGQPYFGAAEPKKEACSVGYFKGTWKPLIENESGLSFEIATAYFVKYYAYIKSGYYTTQEQFYAQARKDEADRAAGKSVKQPANVGGSSSSKKSFLSRLFGR
jgi:hypothetical protein